MAVGSFGVPATAQAGQPLNSVVPTMVRAAIPSAPCHPDGVARADRTIADRLRPSLTGRRLGRAVTGYNVSCARAIVRHVIGRGLPQRAAVIAVTTAITESTLHNYTVAVDHDSLGLFQQRPSMGWGEPAQLVDPGFATNAFLNKMLRAYPANGWMTGDIGQISQRVQVSAYPAAYRPEMLDAQLIVAALWTSPGAAISASPTKPPVAPRKKPAGPFHRSLLPASATGHGPTDGRHHVLLSDWNTDGRPDLVMVQQSGTAGGGTALHILNGLSGFKHSLLLTGTALGPTDDRHTFSVADWNADGQPDLVVTQKSGTASGRTEVRVLDGASNLQRYLLETTTVLAAADDRHTFSVADWNADGHPDLVVTQKSGTASGRTEVRVLDGASHLQRYLLETTTVLAATDDRHTFSVADWNADGHPDLVMIQKAGTAKGRAVVRVLDGASTLQRFLVRASTGQGPTDDRHSLSVVDWNVDGRMDLVVVQKWGTASGRTEAHILAG